MKAQPMIAVRNVPASAHWYTLLLDGQAGHGGKEYEQILQAGELVLQLHDFKPDENHAPLGDAALTLGNGVVLWFETDDFEATATRIKSLGLKLDREPAFNPLARQMEIWLHDPDGYQVVIAGPSEYPRQPLTDQVA